MQSPFINLEYLFCFVDDFCKLYDQEVVPTLLDHEGQKRRRRSGKLSLSERLTIIILYHESPFKDFKRFWKYGIENEYADAFPNACCYERFIATMPQLFFPLTVMMHLIMGGKTGTYYMDSTPLPVCKNQRIGRHKTFQYLAKRGRSSMGWFYGFKLHLVINDQGHIMAVRITQGNVDDRVPVDSMTQNLMGVVAADRGYISGNLFEKLYQRGLKLVTTLKKNMKPKVMGFGERVLLRKRFLVETVNDLIKNQGNFQHSKHRSPANYFTSLVANIIKYQIKRMKLLNFYEKSLNP